MLLFWPEVPFVRNVETLRSSKGFAKTALDNLGPCETPIKTFSSVLKTARIDTQLQASQLKSFKP
jgi:hypothetical protein